MAEDPSPDGILKPHLQHIWDRRRLKWIPVKLSHRDVTSLSEVSVVLLEAAERSDGRMSPPAGHAGEWPPSVRRVGLRSSLRQEPQLSVCVW